MCYDELLNIIGEYGAKQIFIFLIYSFGNTMIVFSFLAPVFLAASPKIITCREPGLDKLNLSSEFVRNISVGGLGECHMYHKNYSNWTLQTVQDWIKNPIDNNTEVVECIYGYEYDPYPYKDTIVNEWELVCGSKWKRHLPVLFMGLGKFFANTFLGNLADNLIEESPRWLYAKGEKTKSFEILKSIAVSNKRSFPEHVKLVKKGRPKEVPMKTCFLQKILP